jgi:hypothetical protein
MVLMTGYSEKLDQGHVLPCAVIPKPFGRAELEAAFLLGEQGRDADVVHLYPKPARHV